MSGKKETVIAGKDLFRLEFKIGKHYSEKLIVAKHIEDVKAYAESLGEMSSIIVITTVEEDISMVILGDQ